MEIESPRSPKRRRILASINPPDSDVEDDNDDAAKRRRKRHRKPSASVSAFGSDGDREPYADDHDMPAKRPNEKQEDPDGTAPRPTKFRFKSKHSHRSSSRRQREEGDDDLDDRPRRHRHHHRHRSSDRDGADSEKPRRHHHRRHHHRPRSPSQSRAQTRKANPFEQEQALDPETAFRESLFDALADDEGAAYWEAVYGQPIHIYAPPTSQRGGSNSNNGGGGGELERMSDEEYAAYVRQKMWERTHAGLLEARARREREREEEARRAEEAQRIAREMERSLARGEERRRRKAWREQWDRYTARWAEWDAEGGGGGVEGIPWPGEDCCSAEGVRAFFVNGLGLQEVGEKEFLARLKEERVRWHPDKIQQRLGGKVGEEVMRKVTGIFQAVDALWNDTRRNAG
jgi:hypothetical protein